MAIDRGVSLDRPWSRAPLARVVREIGICGIFATIVAAYARREITGRECFEKLDGPVVLVANHCSHVDTPLILRCLPARLRRRTLVAAAADYFYTDRRLASAVSLAFGTVPLQRRAGPNGGAALAELQPLIEAGWSILMFAEGTRSRSGRVGRLRVGAAALAAAHRLPIVPIHVSGTAAAMPVGSRWLVRPPGGRPLARHTLRVRFGSPIAVDIADDPLEVMEMVRRFMDGCGAQTSPDERLHRRRSEGRDTAGVGPPTAEA